MTATDETNITDLELLPDGRICVFGTSLQVLDLLNKLQAGLDATIQRRLDASCTIHVTDRGASNAAKED